MGLEGPKAGVDPLPVVEVVASVTSDFVFMSPITARELKPSLRLDARIVPDRRRHKRYALALLGRFMRANKQEFPCRLNDISVGGASFMSPVEVDLGERIVAYLDEIGGIEGEVVRTFEGGFAIALRVTQHKREKLAAQITWLLNKEELGGSAGRRHQRTSMVNKTSTLRLQDGSTVDCRVLDVSLSGASIGTDRRHRHVRKIALQSDALPRSRHRRAVSRHS